MPMINGVKMACEPCIRGHRSTKCNHASERVMLPVRKPGRPLSICPHPPNNGCACATVTAALPRAKKCGCGSKSSSAAGVNGASGNGSAANSSKTPRSPSRRAFFKAPTSPKSLARSRIDPSVLGRTDMSQVNIRAPPPGTSGWPTNEHPQSSIDDLSSLAGPGHPNGQQYMLPNESLAYFSNQGEQSAMFQQPGAPGAYAQHGYPIQHDPASEHAMYATNGGHNDFNEFFNNGMDMSAPLGEGLDGFGLNLNARPNQMNGFHGLQFQTSHAAPPQVSAPAPSPAVATTKGSCCAPATQPQHLATESARHTPTSSTNSLASNGGGSGSGTTATSNSNGKSCCSGSPVTASSASSQQQQQHTMLKSESSIGGGPGPVSLSSVPLAATAGGDVKPMANGHGHVDQYGTLQQQPQLGQYAGYAQQQQQAHGAPTWYRYPPEYGTVTAPLQPSQWRSSLITAGPDAGLYLQGGHQQQQQPHQQHQQQQQSQSYDPAALQHQQPPPHFAVQGNDMVPSDDDLHMCSCGDGCDCVGCVAHPFNNATRDTVRSVWSLMDDSSSNASASSGARTVTTTLPAQTSNVDSTSSPQQVFTPAGASDTSGVSEDQQVSLPAGDFLFVSYSVIACDGEGLMCPCGDDCQCVGCTIHNNTL
ncbi:hypothetical protein Sste5346_004524 [Sporothrix stenoceras]|uniref:Copper-fist domain-containing protein n=1 Tax=Sporothrix stenoceras TaxID=5173 RepID=A0ABR3Z8T1_9PEZI